MKTPDRVSPELRKAEKEVDNHYKSNPLVNLPFTTAVWSLLAYAEEYMLKERVSGVNGIQDAHTLGSDFITELEHPMSWLYGICKQNGEIPLGYNPDIYKASKALFELGQKYDWFVFAYTYASSGILGLELQGSTLQPTGDFFSSIEYEAYNILIDTHEPEEVLSSMNLSDFPIDAIQHSLRIEGDRFRYNLNPRMVSNTRAFLKPLFDRMFLLPSEWQFSR